MSAANERPYLWLLYIIALVMPFVLCAACCVKSKVHSNIDIGGDDTSDNVNDIVLVVVRSGDYFCYS